MFVVEGSKIVTEILKDDGAHPEAIFGLPAWIRSNPTFVKKWHPRIFQIKESELSKISNLKTPNEVLLVHPFLPLKEPANKEDWLLYLDRINNPGNLGTILRIAEWFGIGKVFLSPGTAEVYSPKVVQASMGSFYRVPWEYMEFNSLMDKFREKLIYVTDPRGAAGQDLAKLSQGILVIGNESEGISEKIRSFPHTVLSVPEQRGNTADSLNAAVATGILLALIRYAQK